MSSNQRLSILLSVAIGTGVLAGCSGNTAPPQTMDQIAKLQVAASAPERLKAAAPPARSLPLAELDPENTKQTHHQTIFQIFNFQFSNNKRYFHETQSN